MVVREGVVQLGEVAQVVVLLLVEGKMQD